MASISAPIKDATGKQVGTYELDPAELAPRISKQLLHDVVVMYENNLRQGTVKTKGRGEVAGSTIKIFRQKGTGRARAGNKRTGKRVGGGHAHPKVPVDYRYRLPRKAIRLATRMAILSKFQDGQVVVLDQLRLPEPKTKHVVATLKALGLSETSALLAIEKPDPLVWRSARNIESLWVSPAGELNAYDVLHQRQLVLTKAALDWLRNPTNSEN